MAEQVFVMTGDTLEPVDEQPFELEDDLQELLAKHPRLLGNALRWLLVTREKGVADAPEGADRWSLDHLFVDQDAVPTLVEVKRGRNSQIRREVVGQMLDYAANGSQFWTEDEIRDAFEREHEGSGEPADAVLQEFLREEDSTADDFWRRVATNLAARRMRFVFVADAIPPELVRIVEFLNAQMRDIEVLAVEIKQFKGNNQTETLVSRVIGDTAVPPGKNLPLPTRTRVTEDEFYSRLPREPVRAATKHLLDVARESGAKVVWGGQGLSIRVDVPKEIWNPPVTVAWFFPEPGRVYWAGLRDFSFGAAYPDYHNKRLNGIMSRWADYFSFGEGVTFDGENGGGRTLTHNEVVEHQDALASGLATVVAALRRLRE